MVGACGRPEELNFNTGFGGQVNMDDVLEAIAEIPLMKTRTSHRPQGERMIADGEFERNLGAA